MFKSIMLKFKKCHKKVVNSFCNELNLSSMAIAELGKRKKMDLFFYKLKSSSEGTSIYEKFNPYENNYFVFDVYTKDFGISVSSIDLINKERFNPYQNLENTDKDLLFVVKHLGEKANGLFSKLMII